MRASASLLTWLILEKSLRDFWQQFSSHDSAANTMSTLVIKVLENFPHYRSRFLLTFSSDLAAGWQGDFLSVKKLNVIFYSLGGEKLQFEIESEEKKVFPFEWTAKLLISLLRSFLLSFFFIIYFLGSSSHIGSGEEWGEYMKFRARGEIPTSSAASLHSENFNLDLAAVFHRWAAVCFSFISSHHHADPFSWNNSSELL